jgi:hypothetical protein
MSIVFAKKNLCQSILVLLYISGLGVSLGWAELKSAIPICSAWYQNLQGSRSYYQIWSEHGQDPCSHGHTLKGNETLQFIYIWQCSVSYPVSWRNHFITAAFRGKNSQDIASMPMLTRWCVPLVCRGTVVRGLHPPTQSDQTDIFFLVSKSLSCHM